MNPHHRARRLALQGLCCLDAQGPGGVKLVHEFIADSREPAETLRAARDLLDEAHCDWPACDGILARHARHWDLSRLALVDRNILRLAAHELRFAKAPPKVVITEAIRLAREFSTAESPRFINGVLDAVAREIQAAEGESQEKMSRDAGDAGDTD
ncbi:MAG: transcription antitermination factor NusB [Phycisphaerae bacterium]